MNAFAIIAVFFIALSVHNCGRTVPSAEPAEYIQWVEDPENGLHVSRQIGELSFEVQFKPLDYLVLQDNGGTPLKQADHERAAAELSDMQYFTLRVSDTKGGDLLRSDAENVGDFSSRLAYFSGAMQHDIFLVEGTDTLSCLLYHFERTYGVDPRSTFVLGFPFSKNNKQAPLQHNKTLFFDDQELGVGPVLFTIDAEKLKQIPPLNLNSYATAADQK